MMNVCLYHSSDLDGKCSGAIYYRAMKERGELAMLIGIDYGDPVPWEVIDKNDVTLVDFSIQPFEEFVELFRRAESTTWIDHHRSAISEYLEKTTGITPTISLVNMDIKTRLNEKMAGCELAWQYYFPDEPIPFGVMMLSRYDVWDHGYDSRIMPYQYGVRFAPNDPLDYEETWRFVFGDSPDGAWTKDCLERGQLLLEYQSQNDAAAVGKTWFSLHWLGRRWQACNRLGKGSTFFASVWNPREFDGMLSFGWNGGKWNIGLFSDRNDIDCGALAKQMGGGGHQGAAGFQCTELPFALGKQPFGNAETVERAKA